MIEYYEPHKKIWIKIIASVLVVTFLWYDIAWAGDLFYMSPRPSVVPKESIPTIDGSLGKKTETEEEKDREVTNYDLLYYNKRRSAAGSPLPSDKEKKPTPKFSPRFRPGEAGKTRR